MAKFTDKQKAADAKQHRWATKQLKGDLCMCEDCKSARAVLRSLDYDHHRLDSVFPRYLLVAVRKGLKIANSIGVEEADDRTWLTIRFKKFPVKGKRDGQV